MKQPRWVRARPAGLTDVNRAPGSGIGFPSFPIEAVLPVVVRSVGCCKFRIEHAVVERFRAASGCL